MSPRRTARIATGVLVCALAAGAEQSAIAQTPPRQPTPNDTLVSPEILPDGRVTFRIYAPKASSVTLRGDWMDAPGPLALTKDDAGVWSVTAGPLRADFYSYTFTVDGVRTLDPKNATIKQGIAGVDNMFFLEGPEAAFQAQRAVPHGEIRKAWYSSTTLGGERRVHVYTPPGYDKSSTRYPVLYLLHGGGDEDSGWSTVGRAGFILDNLLADKKAVPMLVVMPNGSLPRPATTPGAPPNPSVTQALQERFTNELMKDVVPFIEKNYRVIPEASSRAIAGLSMGGGQTLRVVTAHPDQFAYAAIWSSGLNPQLTADFETRADAFLSNPRKTNAGFRLLSISVGDKDFVLEGSKNLAAVLTKHGITHQMHVTGGGHTWINWRQYLNDLAPRLFRHLTGPTN